MRVPAVIAAASDFLALEWVEAGALDAAGEEALGRGLARVRRGRAGLRRSSTTRRPTCTSARWASTRRRRRVARLLRRAAVRPLIAPAVERGSLSRARRRGGRPRLRPDATSPGRRSRPRACTATLERQRDGRADGGAWLIDPVAYGGHREVDLAMLRLFGGPSPRVFAAYGEAAPLADGHEERVELWQLFPLMVHAVLFGGGYGALGRGGRAPLRG